MLSIYGLKPRFQNLLRPLSNFLARRHVTPNQVTLATLLLCLLSGMALSFWHRHALIFYLVPIILFIRMMLNAIDGMLAREYHMTTPLGMYLNELGDVLSDVFIYLPFCLIPGVAPLLVLFIIFLLTFSEMTGIIGVAVHASRRYDGPMGKSDRAFVFGLISILFAAQLITAYWVNVIFSLISFLLVFTIKNRIFNALKERHA